MGDSMIIPTRVKVIVLRGKSGIWVAELPEFDIHTEADDPVELEFMVNDLIFAYFDVPKPLWNLIRYVPERPKKTLEDIAKKPIMFQKFISPDAARVLV